MTTIRGASRKFACVAAAVVAASVAVAPALATSPPKPKPADSSGVSQYVEQAPSATGQGTSTAPTGSSPDSSGVSQYVEQVPSAGAKSSASNTRKLLLAVVVLALLTIAAVAGRVWLRRPRPTTR
jgi:cobalamin biosynthesis Mg chelatase CobN